MIRFMTLNLTNSGSLRIPVHLDRPGHRRVCSQRILRSDHEPGLDRRRHDQFLWRCGSILTNAALLAVLDLLPGPLYIPSRWSARRSTLGRQGALRAVGMGELRRSPGTDVRRVYGQLPL